MITTPRLLLRSASLATQSRRFTTFASIFSLESEDANPLTRRSEMPFGREPKTDDKAAAAANGGGAPHTESKAESHDPRSPRHSGVNLLNSIPAPPLDLRWVHTGNKVLELPTVPIASAADSAYKPFSVDESSRIEAAWQKLDNRREIAEMWGREDGEWGEKVSRRERERMEKEKDKERKSQSKGKKGEAVLEPELGKQDMPRPTTPTPPSSLPSDVEDTPEQSKSELYKSIVEQALNDPERLDVVKGVPVAQDSLFEVDLQTLSLHPVFWPQSGARIPVLRGTWFMGDETKPCTWDLAEEIEKGYQEIKPWLPSYKEEIAKALVIGPSGEEKLKYKLPTRFGTGLGIVFEDDTRCRLIASGTMDYVSRYVWSSLGTKPGGTFLYRGFTAAATAKEAEKATENDDKKTGHKKHHKDKLSKDKEAAALKDKEPETADNPKDEPDAEAKEPDTLQDIMSRVKHELNSKKKALEEANAPVIHAKNDEQPCTDLILVVHGIGQNLATQYESFNFIYASNQLRQVLRKQSSDPALASVMRDRRVQILPVQWRANLKIDTETDGQEAQFEKENVFTIKDITIGKSIPYVREITNSVLLDIPLFMSDHKTKMIEAVCQQANGLYRLWVARHPEFENHGRVHIIGHSLGSALAAEILSHQPTIVPKISQLPRQVVEETTDRFLFNTSNLFLAGSPLGVFLQLQQAHIIARAGRARTFRSPPDEAFTLPGRFGCMAVDNLYNIFYPTDPIAYALNPAVDVAVAKERPPLAIPSVAQSMFASLPPLPSMPSMPTMPDMSKYLPSYFTTDKPIVSSPEAEVEIELQSGDMCLLGSRGERRFAALNPRGAIDFALPNSSVNDYLDMITAHGNYWNDNNFGAFILNETFASTQDEARTGRAVETVPGVEVARV